MGGNLPIRQMPSSWMNLVSWDVPGESFEHNAPSPSVGRGLSMHGPTLQQPSCEKKAHRHSRRDRGRDCMKCALARNLTSLSPPHSPLALPRYSIGRANPPSRSPHMVAFLSVPVRTRCLQIIGQLRCHRQWVHGCACVCAYNWAHGRWKWLAMPWMKLR